MGRSVSPADPSLKCSLHKAHFIVYRVSADRLEIIRILHARSDWATLLDFDIDDDPHN
jgi:plasmid stabilization system protein ParE